MVTDLIGAELIGENKQAIDFLMRWLV